MSKFNHHHSVKRTTFSLQQSIIFSTRFFVQSSVLNSVQFSVIFSIQDSSLLWLHLKSCLLTPSRCSIPHVKYSITLMHINNVQAQEVCSRDDLHHTTMTHAPSISGACLAYMYTVYFVGCCLHTYLTHLSYQAQAMPHVTCLHLERMSIYR